MTSGPVSPRPLLAVVLTAAALLLACGDPDPVQPPPGPPSLTVTPVSMALVGGDSAKLKATLLNAPGGVDWAVEGANAGMVTADGTYTAPLDAGTYRVVATSQQDPSLSATVTFTVTAVELQQVPADLTLVSSEPVKFSTRASGSDGTVVWTIEEGATGGTISGSSYVAPFSPGTYHLVVTSRRDPRATARIAVEVFEGLFGTVKYAGAQTGPIHVRSETQGVGVMIDGPGPFRIRVPQALRPTEGLVAYMDVSGHGARTWSSPADDVDAEALAASGTQGVSLQLRDPDIFEYCLAETYPVVVGRDFMMVDVATIETRRRDVAEADHVSLRWGQGSGLANGGVLEITRPTVSMVIIDGLTDGEWRVSQDIRCGDDEVVALNSPSMIGPTAAGATLTGQAVLPAMPEGAWLYAVVADADGNPKAASRTRAQEGVVSFQVPGVPRGILGLGVMVDVDGDKLLGHGDIIPNPLGSHLSVSSTGSGTIAVGTIRLTAPGRLTARTESASVSTSIADPTLKHASFVHLEWHQPQRVPRRLTAELPGVSGPVDLTTGTFQRSGSRIGLMHSVQEAVNLGGTVRLTIVADDGTEEVQTQAIRMMRQLPDVKLVSGAGGPTASWSWTPALEANVLQDVTILDRFGTYYWAGFRLPSGARSARWNQDGTAVGAAPGRLQTSVVVFRTWDDEGNLATATTYETVQ